MHKLSTLFVKLVIALTFALVGCGGAVDAPSGQPVAPLPNYCFANLGACTYEWPIPQSQIDKREITCPSASAIITDATTIADCGTATHHELGRQCSMVVPSPLCDHDHYLESCDYPHTQPVGCVAPIGSELQESSLSWCCQ